MATGKKSIKGTTKRGKVTRISSRTKARSANKTDFTNIAKARNYQDVKSDMYKLMDTYGNKWKKNHDKILRYEQSLRLNEQKIKKYSTLYVDSKYGKNKGKTTEYLSKLNELRKKKDDLILKITTLKFENSEISDKLDAYSNIVGKVEPVRWYYALQSRKASDRFRRAVGYRNGYYNDHYNDEPIRRK